MRVQHCGGKRVALVCKSVARCDGGLLVPVLEGGVSYSLSGRHSTCELLYVLPVERPTRYKSTCARFTRLARPARPQ